MNRIFFIKAFGADPLARLARKAPMPSTILEKILPFIGLHASQHKALKSYGQKTKIFKIGLLPTQAIIDKSDKIQFTLWPLILDIPENKELLDLAQNAFTPAAAVH